MEGVTKKAKYLDSLDALRRLEGTITVLESTLAEIEGGLGAIQEKAPETPDPSAKDFILSLPGELDRLRDSVASANIRIRELFF